MDSQFENCHSLVNYNDYYKACVFDTCTVPNSGMECASLQIYAATCADQGACIDWRRLTHGVCSVRCPSNKVYKACGPTEEQTCKSGLVEYNSTKPVEGCFCPQGTMLYDAGVDVCVKTCGCVGPDNTPRNFGEEFEFDCKNCVCLEGGNGIICEPHKCPKQEEVPQCTGEGFYEVTDIDPDDICCTVRTCRCNTSFCTTLPPKCHLGFEVHSSIPLDQCCPVYTCRKSLSHLVEGSPGSQVLGDKCQDCHCTDEWDKNTHFKVISCTHVKCNMQCNPGYELQASSSDCCGKCVQTKCVIHTDGNNILILSPGEVKNSPKDNCTMYSCVTINRQLISSTSEISCPEFLENACQPVSLPHETPSPCSLTSSESYITHQGCRSLEKISLTQCQGMCGTFSLYSAEANSMEHKCSCCREVSTTKREVLLRCPNGRSVKHSYLHVDSCDCLSTECNSSNETHSVATTRKQIT
uniref:Uncharacterized protein n=1 Tax=Sphenodon punctatus TaxID=8508 RepID=A0A8D0GDZ3_SPHPU